MTHRLPQSTTSKSLISTKKTPVKAWKFFTKWTGIPLTQTSLVLSFQNTHSFKHVSYLSLSICFHFSSILIPVFSSKYSFIRWFGSGLAKCWRSQQVHLHPKGISKFMLSLLRHNVFIEPHPQRINNTTIGLVYPYNAPATTDKWSSS
jgi:hypothetical protein